MVSIKQVDIGNYRYYMYCSVSYIIYINLLKYTNKYKIRKINSYGIVLTY